MKSKMSTLIVARPSRIRDGLRALLKTIPEIEIIDQVDNGPAALKLITHHRPNLVLLDSNLPGGETWTVLQQTKTVRPQTRCIVLADNIQQQWAAKAAGADGTLLNGFPAAKLFATIEGLLSRQEA
jgi:DNA-binding NarL/FixJ family response regulator